MTATPDRVGSLERGEAFVDLSGWWKVGVEGAEAHGWLNDLLSAELDGIADGESRLSLLLTPTGRIRAAVTITPADGGHLLLQDPSQPSRIDSLLDPYVLSSDVRLRDRSEELGLFAFPGGQAPRVAGERRYSPSVLGPGVDVLLEGGRRKASGVEERVEAALDDVETWRVRRGVARFGVDLTPDALPHEVELGETIAYGKGCFLGQEAVARVRNLGHPPFVLLAADAEAADAGEKVLAGERDAGTVTSAAPHASGGIAVIARVRWALKDAPLRTASGVELRSRGLASAA